MPEQRGEVIESHQVGPHYLEIERPDIVHIRYEGDVSLLHFKKFDEIIQSMPHEIRIYLLRDGRRGGIALPDARAYMASAAHLPRIIAVVTYGSSFRGQTVVKMTNLAIRRLTQHEPEVSFCDTEAEARLWIAEHRSARC